MININSEIRTTDKILRVAMYKIYSGKCFYTGRPISFEDVHIDHILAQKNGGKNCIGNYTLCCSEINLRKNNSNDDYFVERVTLINNLLFSNKVVSEYNNIYMNNQIYNGYININHFVKEKGILHSERAKFVQKAKRNVPFVEIYPQIPNKNGIIEHQTKKRFFFDKNHLNSFYKTWQP